MKPWRVPYPKFGDGPGLERVAAVAAALGVDLKRFGETGAAIVGSNGKGSTAAMSAALLRQARPRMGPVGVFTSPHLFALNERFAIDGLDIDDAELAKHWPRVTDAVERLDLSGALGGFEFLFLIAADWFAARGCAHTIWEAGIGGRLDPVRLIEARRLALTSLDFEHTELLGTSLEAIAREKIDAAPQGATLFVPESCAALPAIEAYCAARGVILSVAAADALPVAPPLFGAHQRANAALALHLARDIAPLSDAAAVVGFAATRWPGRLEILAQDPLIVIDVGHTPAGVAAALDGFRGLRGERSGVLVCGASHDKNAAALIAALAPDFAVIICTAARHKGAPAAQIAAFAAEANPDAELALAELAAEARSLALARTRAGGAIYVAGGLFVAAEFRAAHFGRDVASLAFF